MKLTTKRLKQLIKEELSEMMHTQQRYDQADMSKQQKLEKIVDLIVNDDIGLVGYPGSPDARSRLSGYGDDVGMRLDTIDNLEDLRNSLIMSDAQSENTDMVVRFLTKVISVDDNDFY